MLHKLIYNKNKAIIYVSTYLLKNQPDIIKKLQQTKLFEKVIRYEEIEILNTNPILSKEKLNSEIVRVSNEVDKKIGKVLRKANSIYMCSDFYSIGFFLIHNKIKYNYFEDGCGVLSQNYLAYRIVEKNNPNRAEITKILKTFGENSNVVNRYGSLKDQVSGYSNKKDIDFCVKDLLKSLSDKDIIKILKVFNAKKINLKDNKTNLLLTLHYNDLMKEKDQIDIYTYIVDYFTEPDERLIIKPHPADSISRYEEIFSNSIELYRYMPSELFPYCINRNIDKGLTCWSTAIYGLSNFINDIVCFDTDIDNTFRDFDKYYVIVMALKNIKSNKIQKVVLNNANYLQLIQLMKYHFSDYEKYYEIEKNDNLENIKSTDIVVTTKLSKELKNMVFEIDCQFNCRCAVEIRKNKANIISKEYIGLYNFDKFDLKVSKEMKYSNYSFSTEIIENDKYIKSILESNILIKSQTKTILDRKEKEQEELLRKKDNKIWELNQHIKYLDGIIIDLEKQKQSLLTEVNLSFKKRLKRKIKKILTRKDDK